MKKILPGILLIFFPLLAMAAGDSGSLSFAPPPSDISKVFLTNIFGIVDGVLPGGGSQILGNMFGVFNSAVLALGGMVVMYTLMVSTVNTAHEGEMLGKKWSEIWIPVRSSLGLALLIPKASGYCAMQIFFMWIVLQGVGAADKVWSSALSYLNRGGVIVQAMINPTTALLGGDGSVTSGAATILSGQTCMLGLEKSLSNHRAGLLNAAADPNDSGDCYGDNITDTMKAYCSTTVPSFLSSVDAVSYQTARPNDAKYILPMPNFSPTGPEAMYASLNGVCGNITWNSLNSETGSISNINTLSQSEITTANMSRAIAIQQMYMDLSFVGQRIVENDPDFSSNSALIPPPPPNGYAHVYAPLYQFGVPFMSTGTPCTGMDNNCIGWAGLESVSGKLPPMFNGTEFQGAIADYNAIMLPTLTLINESKNATQANQIRAFINDANASGWILAGSYFFSLANINAANSTTNSSDPSAYLDQNTGLGDPPATPLTTSISNVLTCPSPSSATPANQNLCQWLGTDSGNTQDSLRYMLNFNDNFFYSIPSSTNPGSLPATPTSYATTVYGFINNSLVIHLPGQPGLAPYQFQLKMIPDFMLPANPPKISFDCGKVKILWPFSFCLVKWMGQLLWDVIFKTLFDWIFNLMVALANKCLMIFLKLPLEGMAYIFKQGIAYIQAPGVNPVVGLAFMGISYINFANDLWMLLVATSIMASFLGPAGLFIFAIIALISPMLIAWLGVMVVIGFITAYYVPFLPYMMFTFGSIAWLISVIEAMVAAPIVALGVTHPEGEGPFGKAEQSIMILMNVFLRPSLMVFGLIAGFILSYVGVWVLNAGFANIATFINGTGPTAFGQTVGALAVTPDTQNTHIQTANGYTGWAGIYGFFFSIIIYVTMYMTMVQKAFTLIAILPDKVLHWIGGEASQLGTDAAQWSEESKTKVGEAGKALHDAQGQMGKALGGYAGKGAAKGAAEAPKAQSGSGD